MVCLGRPYHFKFFKACLPQVLLGPFLNTLDPYVDHKKVSLVLVLFSISQRWLALHSIWNFFFICMGGLLVFWLIEAKDSFIEVDSVVVRNVYRRSIVIEIKFSH